MMGTGKYLLPTYPDFPIFDMCVRIVTYLDGSYLGARTCSYCGHQKDWSLYLLNILKMKRHLWAFVMVLLS